MEHLLALSLGIGISAAAGFRIFLPPLVVGLGAVTGHVTLPDSAAWLAHPLVIAAFGAAALFELLGYMIPWLDHLLDVVAAPTAVVAGTVLTASFIGDMDPALRWPLAIIAGGGAAATTQFATTVARAASTATTGGMGNPFFSFLESVASTVTSIIALLLPLVIAIMIVALAALLIRRLVRRGARAERPMGGGTPGVFRE